MIKKRNSVGIGVLFIFVCSVVIVNANLRQGSPNLPQREQIERVEIYPDYIKEQSSYITINDAAKIDGIYMLFDNAKRIKNKKSVSDVPKNNCEPLIKIILKDDVYYLYQEGYKEFYLERPYEGVYKINYDDYATISAIIDS